MSFFVKKMVNLNSVRNYLYVKVPGGWEENPCSGKRHSTPLCIMIFQSHKSNMLSNPFFRPIGCDF